MFRTMLLSCAAVAGMAACKEAKTVGGTGYSNLVEGTRSETAGTVAAPEPAPAPIVGTPEEPGVDVEIRQSITDDVVPDVAPDVDLGADAYDANADANAQEVVPGQTQDEVMPEQGAANSTTIRARTVTPPRGRATTPRDANDTTRAGANTGTSTTGTSGASVPPETTPQTTPSDFDADTSESPSEGTSGLNETASGHGTTTNTGTNTENQGTGGTDDPTR